MNKFFNFFDSKRDTLNKYLKNRTSMGFADWGMFILLITGLVLIIVFSVSYGMGFKDSVSIGVLWFTGIVILKYTEETYWLKQLQQKDLKFQKAPFVIVHFESEGHFVLKNVGKGVARNVHLEVKPNKHKLNFPQKTIISPQISNDQSYTRICDPDYMKLDPTESQEEYKLIIRYQNLDGIDYITELKSGKGIDDYEVIKYEESK